MCRSISISAQLSSIMCCQIPDYFLSKSQRNNSSIVFTLLSLISEAWRASLAVQLVRNLPAMQETLVWFLGWEDALDKDRLPTPVFLGFPGDKVCPQFRRPGFNPWVGEIPWRKAWQPTPVLLPGESHGQRNLVGYSPWDHKESDTTEHLSTQHNWG